MSFVGGSDEVNPGRKPLKLSRSGVIKGAELYESRLVDSFDTGWHLHEGWQFAAINQGARRYEFKSGTIVARPRNLVLLPPNLIHRADAVERGKLNRPLLDQI